MWLGAEAFIAAGKSALGGNYRFAMTTKQRIRSHLLATLGLGSFVSGLSLFGLLVIRSLLLITHLFPLLTELLGDVTNLLLVELELLHHLVAVLSREEHVRRQGTLDLIVLRDSLLSFGRGRH
jgi:hypothetical protein